MASRSFADAPQVESPGISQDGKIDSSPVVPGVSDKKDESQPSAEVATTLDATQAPQVFSVNGISEKPQGKEESLDSLLSPKKELQDAAASRYINGLVGKQPKKLCWLLHQFSKKDGKALLLNRAILYGPPGNGKSTTARVFAKESGSVFVARSACSMVERYVGTGPANITEMFNSAHELVAEGKKVVIFIDEIDALAASNDSEFRGEHKAALQQLWIELDGCKKDPNIFVFFATNEFKKLSKTIIDRCGSNTIEITHPKAPMRKQVLEHYAEQAGIFLSDAQVAELVTKTKGLSVRSVEDFVMALRMATDLSTKGKLTKQMMLAELALIHKKFKENTSEEKEQDPKWQRIANKVSIIGGTLGIIHTIHTLGSLVYLAMNPAPQSPMDKFATYGLEVMQKGFPLAA